MTRGRERERESRNGQQQMMMTTREQLISNPTPSTFAPDSPGTQPRRNSTTPRCPVQMRSPPTFQRGKRSFSKRRKKGDERSKTPQNKERRKAPALLPRSPRACSGGESRGENRPFFTPFLLPYARTPVRERRHGSSLRHGPRKYLFPLCDRSKIGEMGNTRASPPARGSTAAHLDPRFDPPAAEIRRNSSPVTHVGS